MIGKEGNIVPKVLVDVDKKRNDHQQARHSEKQRLQAVNAYVVLGKVTLVAATTGIPEDTLRKWKASDWWKEAEDEIRRSNKIQLSGRLQTVVQRTLAELEDRVANGDFFFNPKTGKWDRKPISAVQANRVVNDLIDKSMVLEKTALEEKVTEEGLDLRLQKLKEEMIRFAKAKTIEGEIVNELPKETHRINPELVPQEANGNPDSGTTEPCAPNATGGIGSSPERVPTGVPTGYFDTPTTDGRGSEVA